MKKLLSLSLAALLAFSIVAFAATTQENDVMLISEAETTAMPEKVSYNGIISEVTEDYIVIGDNEFQFNIDENTYVCDYDFSPVETLKAKDVITVVASSMTTRSMPPQAYAYYIFVKTTETEAYPIYAVVDTNDGEAIMSADGNNRIVYTDETPVTAHKIRIALKASDITPGSEIVAFASVVGMSLPAHVPAEKIGVLSLAEEKEVNGVVISGHTFEYADTALFEDGSAPRLPLRHVLETLGYTVNWNDKDWSIDIAGRTKNIVRIQIGSAMFEGQAEENFPVLVDSTTYVTAEIFDLIGLEAE